MAPEQNPLSRSGTGSSLPTLDGAQSGRRRRSPALRTIYPRQPLSTLRADPRQAVQHDSIRCLVCGGVFRQLTNTHLRGHRMTANEYKHRFGYNRGRPLMCRELRSLYAVRAVKSGLAARIRQRPILVKPELRKQGGTRQIALEELLTRREVRRRGGRVEYPAF